jgi:predicted HTH transcriptional regulator
MFNLLNVGDRAGTGLSTIWTVWKEQNWIEPVLEEQFNPDRTVLSLVLAQHGTNVTDNVIENDHVSDTRRGVYGGNGGINGSDGGINGENGRTSVDNGGLNSVNGGLSDGDGGLNGGLNGGKRKIVLDLLARDPKITVMELSEAASIPVRTVERIMSELRSDGKILRIGSKKSGHWQVLD